jgi:toxin-antitoxin system PIN domain toxin
VILVDVNILIYAHNSGSGDLAISKKWLEQALSDAEPVGFPWAVIHAFLRLTTGKLVLPRPLEMPTALSIVDDWLSAPNARIAEPGPQYWAIFRTLVKAAQITGKLVSDTHIAALAIEHDAVLCTADRDFRRFPNLRVINPLA